MLNKKKTQSFLLKSLVGRNIPLMLQLAEPQERKCQPVTHLALCFIFSSDSISDSLALRFIYSSDIIWFDFWLMGIVLPLFNLVMFDQPVGWQKVLFHQSVDCIFSRQDSWRSSFCIDFLKHNSSNFIIVNSIFVEQSDRAWPDDLSI